MTSSLYLKKDWWKYKFSEFRDDLFQPSHFIARAIKFQGDIDNLATLEMSEGERC